MTFRLPVLTIVIAGCLSNTGTDTDPVDTEVDTELPDTDVPDTDLPDTDLPDTDVPDTDTPVSPVDVSRLTRSGGCGDLNLTMGSTDGELLLKLWHDGGLAMAAYQATSGTASVTLDLASEGSLVLWEGTQVDALACNDAWTGTEEIVTTWSAIAGTAEVSVVSDQVHEPWDAYPGTGSITLTDVVLHVDGMADVSIPSLSWSAAVGWLPG